MTGKRMFSIRPASPGQPLGTAHDAHWSELQPRLWAYAVSVGASKDEADDIVQEAVSRLVSVEADGAGPADESAWLFTVVHHLVADAGRRRGALQRAILRLSGLRESQGSDAAPGLPEEVWAAVDTLPMRQRAAIYLRFRGDLNFSAIAAVLGVTESAARSYVAKGLDKLEERMSPGREPS